MRIRLHPFVIAGAVFVALAAASCSWQPAPAERRAFVARLMELYPDRPIIVVVSADSAAVAWERAKRYLQSAPTGPLRVSTDELVATDFPADDGSGRNRLAYEVRREARGDTVAFHVGVRLAKPSGLPDEVAERELALFIATAERYVGP